MGYLSSVSSSPSSNIALTRFLTGVATIHGAISISGSQLLFFKITFFVLTVVGTIWLVTIGAILFSMQALNTHTIPTETIANGSVFMSILCLALIINVAIIFPALLLLQPLRLWRVLRAEKQAVTPRQRFRGMYTSAFYVQTFIN